MSQLIRRFEAEVWIPGALSDVFSFFADARNLEKITPPWLNFQVLSQSTPSIQEGTVFEYRLRLRGLPVKWKSRITKWEENKRFMDVQLSGPYQRWEHLHEFVEKDGGVLMRDIVDYQLPFGRLGRLVAGWLVDRDVKKIFGYRSSYIKEVFANSS